MKTGFSELIPTGIVVFGAVFIIIVIRTVLKRIYAGKTGLAFKRQAVTLGLFFLALIGLLIALPVSDTLKTQLFTLFGIIISALIALSSSTIISNGMSGFMLRSVKNFKPGDFIEVGEYFGRVSDRGLFHTEIQTINRDLVTIPNHYLVNNPVTVTRTSGTFISGDVSLGYDVSRETVERLLLKAAEEAELKEPFVHVLTLGDFSITYRVYGLLEDVKYLVSSRSVLKKQMLDALHNGKIEIVSPHFMNQRRLEVDRRFLPVEERVKVPADEKQEEQARHAEEVAFDKAEEAESLERLREKIGEADKEIGELKQRLKEGRTRNDDEDKERIAVLESRKKRIAEIVERREQGQEESGN